MNLRKKLFKFNIIVCFCPVLFTQAQENEVLESIEV